jgi:hypothetical protein
VRLCICPPLITFEPTGCHGIQEGGHATEDDLEATLSNSVASTMPKWRTLKLLRRMRNLHQLTWGYEILCSDKSLNDEQLLLRPSL